VDLSEVLAGDEDTGRAIICLPVEMVVTLSRSFCTQPQFVAAQCHAAGNVADESSFI
jgi:hypothetical protein